MAEVVFLLGGGVSGRVCGPFNYSCFASGGVEDCWVWKLHLSRCYNVKSNSTDNQVLWLKTVMLKINSFVWNLLYKCVLTKENLVRRHILDHNTRHCSAWCGQLEGNDHLFVL